MSVTTNTQFLLPQAVIANGAVTGNQFSNPNNVLIVDTDVTASNPNQTASDITIGNFATSIPTTATILGIELELIAKRGAQTNPVITLTPYLLDNTSGDDVYFPYVTPVTTELTPDLTTIILGNPTYLFATTITPDIINNAKFNFVANGDVSIDSCLMKVYYSVPDAPTPPGPPSDSCEDCNSAIQAQPFYLALPFLSGDRYAYLQSFAYPDGTDIEYADLGSCGGYVDLVFDPGVPKVNGSNFEENARTATWTKESNGYIKLDFGDIDVFRGLQFHTPNSPIPELRSNHDANSQVIISDNSPFLNQLLRRCQAGTVFSKPIEVYEDGNLVLKPTVKFNFSDKFVVAEDGTDDEQVNIDVDLTGFGVESVTGNVVDNTDPQNPVVTAVKTVTGLNTDNTDPQNPIVKISTDPTTLSGNGTPGSPLVVIGGGGGGGSGGSSSGSSWQNPDSPSALTGITSVAITIDNVTSYTVATGKRLYIYSMQTNAVEIFVDGIPVFNGSSQNGSAINSIGNPIIVKAGSVITQTSVSASTLIGYLVSTPTTLINVITQGVDNSGTSYTVPSGKMFVLLNTYSNVAGIFVTPSGGSQTVIGNDINLGSTGWIVQQPMFFYPGDIIVGGDVAGAASIHGYEVNLGTQFGGSSTTDIKTFLASSNMTLGDPVGTSDGIVGSVGIAGFFNAKSLALSGISITSVLATPVRINTNKYVFLYDDAGTVKVGIFTLSQTTYSLTFGASVSGIATSDSYNLASIGTDKFAVVRTVFTTPNTTFFSTIGTVSGTTITLGTSTSLVTTAVPGGISVGTARFLTIGSGATDRFVITYADAIAGGGGPSTLYGIAVTVSGTTPTPGSVTTLATGVSSGPASNISLINPISINTNVLLCLYNDLSGGGASGQIFTAVLTQSGTTVTSGTSVAVTTVQNTNIYAMVKYATNKAVICFSNGNVNTSMVSVTGTVPTIGTAVITSASFGPNAFTNLTSVWINGKRYTVSGVTLTDSNEAQFNMTVGTVVATVDGGTFAITIGTPTYSIWYFGQASNMIGVVTATTAKGGQVPVRVIGEATINQAVNSGGYYYVKNGVFTFETDAPNAQTDRTQAYHVKGSALNKVIL